MLLGAINVTFIFVTYGELFIYVFQHGNVFSTKVFYVYAL